MNRSGRPLERDYCSLHCGVCYLPPTVAPEARFFSCAHCGTATFECHKCVSLAAEWRLPPATSCERCCRRRETHAKPS